MKNFLSILFIIFTFLTGFSQNSNINPNSFVIITGTFKNLINPLDFNAIIKVQELKTNKLIATYKVNTDKSYNILLPSSGKYKFIVETPLSEKIHACLIDAPSQSELKVLKQEIELYKKDGEEKLVFKNYFDISPENEVDVTAYFLPKFNEPSEQENNIDPLLDNLKNEEATINQTEVINTNYDSFVIISGTFKNLINSWDYKGIIKVYDLETNKLVDTYIVNDDKSYNVLLPFSGKYKFIVETPLSEKIHAGLIEAPPQRELNVLKQEIELYKKEGKEKLVFRDYFDQSPENKKEIIEYFFPKFKEKIKPNFSIDINDEQQPELTDINSTNTEEEVKQNRVYKQTYNDIPINISGANYSWGQISGCKLIDDYVDKAIDFSWRQVSSFLNFSLNGLEIRFESNGDMTLITAYSYDKTTIEGSERYYPAKKTKNEWRIPRDISPDKSDYNWEAIAIAQAILKVNREDIGFNKIYEVFLSVAEDMDYDYSAIGEKCIYEKPNTLKGVCDDYSVLLIARLKEAYLSDVSDIRKVTGQNHAWVTLKYKGSLLYLDPTWFDMQDFLSDGTLSNTPVKAPMYITFDEELFTNFGREHQEGR